MCLTVLSHPYKELKMKLYYSPTSPFVRKVNVAAIELGLDAQIERIVTNPWIAPEDLSADNPLSKVPTIVLDDGMAVFDSPVICEYLDALHQGKKLIPPEGMERWKALSLQALADGVIEAAIQRFLEIKRPEEHRSSEWDASQHSAIQRSLAYLETQTSDWEEHFDIGQIAVVCALGYLDFRFSHEDWRSPHPQLAVWYENGAMRESLIATVPKVL